MKREVQKNKRLLSGVQPSGALHIGNYLGAIKQWASLQETYETFVPIVDLHALTVPQKPEELRTRTLEAAADFLALGIHPEKAALFLQSQVPEHTQLMWILNTITSLGDLERMTAYKEKIEEGKPASAGLFNYPILMAADILLYKPAVVPVGEDQRQHVELARGLAKRFNKRFGDTFPIPKLLLAERGARIMSLTDPKKKMSKSHGAASYIAISDTSGEIRRKIAAAVTDSGAAIKYDPVTKPAITNLITLYHLFSEKSVKEIEKEFDGKGYKEFKEALSEVVITALKPIQEKRVELLKDKAILMSILNEGRGKAHEVASATLTEVHQKIGLL